MSAVYTHGMSFVVTPLYFAAQIGTSGAQFLIEDGVRIRAHAGQDATAARFRWDGFYKDTLWTRFEPPENYVAGDSGDPLYKVGWSNRLYVLSDSDDLVALESLWVDDWATSASIMSTVMAGFAFGIPRARYFYARARCDRSGADNPSISAGHAWLTYAPPIPGPDDIEATLDAQSPFVQVRALRRQPRYLTFEFNDRNGTPLDLTDVRVQLFLRDKDDVVVGTSPFDLNVTNAALGEADIQFEPQDTDLPPGNYKAEVIAWAQPNYVRREFTLTVEKSGVPAGWDPDLLSVPVVLSFDVA